MPLNFDRVRELFAAFDFTTLFIEELGWSQPVGVAPRTVPIDTLAYLAKPIAQLAGVVVFEIATAGGGVPDEKAREAVHREIAKTHYENLLIFVDKDRLRSEWFWVKRENGKELPRPHSFLRGQPGDLFISKVAPLLFEISDFEKGDPKVVEVARRLRLGLDVEKVTKKFYGEFEQQHVEFLKLISGIDDERQRRWYASVLLNRMMFIWFLQQKGFLAGGDLDYLQHKFDESQARGRDRFFSEFLKLLFFEGFAKPKAERSEAAGLLLGEIRYLNGGLFLPHTVEQQYDNIDVPDRAFANLFKLFRAYSWNLNDTPGGDTNEINPDVLGYIFEKYINQKAFGAYYTRTEITTYLCERTIHRLVLDAVNTPDDELLRNLPGKNYDFKSVNDVLANLDGPLTRKLLREVLPKLSILDPACGSGAFLVAAMKTLINIYTAAFGYARYRDHGDLRRQVDAIERAHTNVEYYVKKLIITKNLYGVDIMEEAVEIAKLRLFLALVASAHDVDQLEPLPNIDFNLLPGNSLIGLMRVDEAKFDKQLVLFGKSYRQVVDEKNRRVSSYRDAATYSEDLRVLRDGIEKLRDEAGQTLDDILLDDFQSLGIKYEQATWDHAKQREGKGKKRPLTRDDIEDLQPFHWGYEFDEIVNKRGGFDAIITNPPWEAVKPFAKEFFADHSDVVFKNRMDIKDFEKELARLVQEPEVMAAWLAYHSRFNHEREYFFAAPDYRNQVPIVGGRRQRSELNLYKLFIERCYYLLRDGGECGLVVPGGIYTDLGSKQLRELLFESTEVTGLFGFENRKQIFEGVHGQFKFVVLTYRKGNSTTKFPAAFMRHDIAELEHFPSGAGFTVSIDLIRRLSPDSLSISEFKDATDLAIAEKMSKFPLLGENRPGEWKTEFHREFDMTDDAYLFHKTSGAGMVPLYEGKMIWQFDAHFSDARYFVEEKVARRAVLRSAEDDSRELDYQRHRLAFRDVAANTNERTMVATLLPSNVFAGNTLRVASTASYREMLYVVSVLNSFVFDWLIRTKVTSHCSIFYVYQMPVPRLAEGDVRFEQLVARSARLICTGSEFDGIAREAGIDGSQPALDPHGRTHLRAEIDAIVAHLYGITTDELQHILAAFPIVSAATKERVLTTFKGWKPAVDDPILRLIAAGESLRVEFKSSARWDYVKKQVNKELESVIVKTVAALMNSDGGTLLIGVADNGKILGLEPDYGTIGKKNADAYENWLTTRLLDSVGRDRTRLLRMEFPNIEGNQVCRVDVARSPRPVFVRDAQNVERLYVRAGNSTRELSVSEALDYCHEHFTLGAPRTEGRVDTTEPEQLQPGEATGQGRLDIVPQRKAASFPTHGLFSGRQPTSPRASGTEPAQQNMSENADDEAGPEPEPVERRRVVDEYNVDDVLLLVRDVVKGSEPIPRNDVIREIATLLGAERVGPRIRDLIESALTTASRRAIIETADGGLVARTHSIDDYDREFLKTALKSVVGRAWTEQSEAIRAATRWLGFRRTGSTIAAAFQSAIRGAIRQRLAERNGTMIRFTG